MQWLILTEGLPVGAWRERIGMSNACQHCPAQAKETLQHAFQECTEIKQVWQLFWNTRGGAGLPPSYTSWENISRGLMTDTPSSTIKKDLRWTQQPLSPSHLTPLGTFSEPKYSGQSGAKESILLSKSSISTLELSFGTHGETQSIVLWRHTRNYSDTHAMKKNNNNSLLASRKTGQHRRFLGD